VTEETQESTESPEVRAHQERTATPGTPDGRERTEVTQRVELMGNGEPRDFPERTGSEEISE